MPNRTAIEWTDATWNPVTGCSKVSAGCQHCYAETLARRFEGDAFRPWVAKWAARNVVLHPDRLPMPLHWRTPRRVFVNSVSDLFHDQVPDAFVDRVFAVMTQASQHQFQVLTKRPERMRAYITQSLRRGVSTPGPMPHVWLGTSVEQQRWVVPRVGALVATPAAVRFLSCEPLLGPLDVSTYLATGGIHWVIVGGESGPGARPVDPACVRALRDQCMAYGVSFFFKQWGGVARARAGRELDGRTWDEWPA